MDVELFGAGRRAGGLADVKKKSLPTTGLEAEARMTFYDSFLPGTSENDGVIATDHSTAKLTRSGSAAPRKAPYTYTR